MSIVNSVNVFLDDSASIEAKDNGGPSWPVLVVLGDVGSEVSIWMTQDGAQALTDALAPLLPSAAGQVTA